MNVAFAMSVRVFLAICALSSSVAFGQSCLATLTPPAVDVAVATIVTIDRKTSETSYASDFIEFIDVKKGLPLTPKGARYNEYWTSASWSHSNGAMDELFSDRVVSGTEQIFAKTNADMLKVFITMGDAPNVILRTSGQLFGTQAFIASCPTTGMMTGQTSDKVYLIYIRWACAGGCG